MTSASQNNLLDPHLPTQAAAEVPTVPRSLSSQAWMRIRRQRFSLICFIIVVCYAVAGLATFAPFFETKIDQVWSADKSYAPPALRHLSADGTFPISPSCWFGLDFQGRSVFWRTLYGCRMALLITVCASVISIFLGTFFGLLGGYFGGWIDDFVLWLYSTISSIPWLLLVIALAYVIQNNQSPASLVTPSRLQNIFGGSTTVILALGFSDWVGLCRLIRGEVIKLRDRDFVVAARALGLGHARIIFQHILPSTMHIIIITFSLGAVSYVQVEVILAFLGLGVTTKPSWGRMIDDSKLELLRGVWWEVTAATVAIFIVCLALNVLGDTLRDALDPRLQSVD